MPDSHSVHFVLRIYRGGHWYPYTRIQLRQAHMDTQKMATHNHPNHGSCMPSGNYITETVFKKFSTYLSKFRRGLEIYMIVTHKSLALYIVVYSQNGDGFV